MRKGEWKSKPKLKSLTTKQLKPEGWLKRQLEIQAGRAVRPSGPDMAGYPGEQMDRRG